MYRLLIVLLFFNTLFVIGCDNGSDSQPPLDELTILVTNDDGIGAPGIDALVNGLRELDGVDVQVVAPAENQSGASDKTSEGEVAYEAAVTASGYPAHAVDGFPADSVRVALNELDLDPHLVVSGVNSGQNVGPFAAVSGTVGAARYAARAGYPAVAGSAGLGSNADYGASAALIAEWIEDNRGAIAEGTARTDIVMSFNVPDCTAGTIRELVAVPLADSIPEGANVFVTDCTLVPESAPIHDVDAMIKGHAAQTEVPLEF